MDVYDFIEKIGKIEVKYSKKFRKQYLTFTEEFTSEQEYNEKLDEYLREFRKEIQRLPFKLNSKHSRKTFLYNLYDEFIYTKELLHEQFKHIVLQSHDCITFQKTRFQFCFPRYFQKKYLLKARKAYHKIHVAFRSRIDKIEDAVEILKVIALNDGIEINTANCYCQERIKTKISSPELAYIAFSILRKVAEDPDFNRSHLSRLLAENFSTKMCLSPKASQIRKHFTEVSDSVKNRVETLFKDLSKTCNS